MAKAKSGAHALSLKREKRTEEVDVLTPIREWAAELQQLYDVMDACQLIEQASEKKTQSNTDQSYKLGVLGKAAKALDNDAYKRIEFIEEAIVNTEPRGAIDAVIVLTMLISKIDSGENWPMVACAATTMEEKHKAVERYIEENAFIARVFHCALDELFKSLAIMPKELGLKSYWCRIETSTRNMSASLAMLRKEADALGL